MKSGTLSLKLPHLLEMPHYTKWFVSGNGNYSEPTSIKKFNDKLAWIESEPCLVSTLIQE